MAAAIILVTCADSFSAPSPLKYPYAGGIMRTGPHGERLLPSVGPGPRIGTVGRRYLGMERPDLFAHLRAKQGPGPIPDFQLTPTATASEELYSFSAPYGELNRIVISSNGVDDDGDGQFDPGATTQDGTFNLWMLRVDGSQVAQITNMAGDELYPAFSPGARLIAFSSNTGGVWQIYTVEVLTGVVTQITSSPGNKYEPTWSPDSNWLVFSGDEAGNRDLYIIPTDGSLLPQQITTNPADETQPTWVPTGAAGGVPILLTREGAGGTGSRIFGISSNGSNETQLSDGGGDPQVNDRDPAWRHNGAMIAFSSDRLTEATDLDRDFNIWTMSSAGETGALAATLRSNLDPEDVQDDRYPCFNPGLNPREPIRVFFTSWRQDAAGAEPDIWRLEAADPVPPDLMDLPSLQWPRDDYDRYRAPGSEITVYAQVFDRDSGVAQVVAEFKDPDSPEDDSQGIDHKQFIYASTGYYRSITSIPGTIAFEVDCDTVGNAQLFDDGGPDSGDAVAGDGIFTGKWTTPMSPSDYIIDIHVADNAGNQFEYDDVYGLTTQMFEPKTNVLFVDDYCEGQAFPWMASGANNDCPTQAPVESYYTTNWGDCDACSSTAYNTFRSGIHGNGWLGEPYDIWRIICRGPVTITDLVYYLPTKEVQLTVPDLTGTREVRIADRAVVWAAPHTGDTWVASGSLVDATMQATLANFLDRGGRLMTSGQDIGFALTLDGTVQNNFFANYLHASYITDSVIAPSNGGGCPWCFFGPSLVSASHPEIQGVADDPVARHPGWNPYHDPPLLFANGWWVHERVCYPQDSALCTVWPDGIDAIGGATVTHNYVSTAAEVAGLRYADPAGGYRVVYFAWGFEQMHRVHQVETNWPYVCRNYRAKLMHNTLCWLRTGGFQGRVLSISDGNQPVDDPTPIVQVRQGNTVIAAVQCEEDGRYVMGGLPPGVYSMSAHRPGFEIDHRDSDRTHGGLNYPVVDFAIVRAEPGAIRGTVTSAATGEPLAAVEVCAYQVPVPEPEDGDGNGGTASASAPAQDGDGDGELGDLIGCTTTAADGTYMIGNVPPGDVDVVADGTDIGYGTETQRTTVTSGNTNTVDFALEAAPGVIVATVTDEDGNPIQDALVEVLLGAIVAASGTTDENGEARIEVEPGSYSVEAEAAGYERSAGQGVAVAAGEEVDIAITLQQQADGGLSGLITRAVSGEAVGGITVELLSISGDTILASTQTSATVTDPPGAALPYNYEFVDANGQPNVPTGQVIVRPDPVGFSATPLQQIVRVETDQVTDSVNFTLSSIHTFPAVLQLMSLPFDYPATDPATVLGVPANDLKMAAFEPIDGRYHVYPSAPADRFRLGVGYWLKLDEIRELSQQGIEAGDTCDIALRLGQSGWNIVGDFFRATVDFYALKVSDKPPTESDAVIRTMQEAMAAGLVRSPLFAYVLGGYQTSAVLEPYVGYWLKVADDVWLIGDRTTVTLAAGEAPARAAVLAPEDGWLLPLVVSAGGMQDAATFIGCAASASDGFDVGLDVPKPPPPDMGPNVYAAIEHGDWGSESGAYAVDVRSAATDNATWRLRISCEGAQTVSVRWPDMSGVPTEARPVLSDPAAGRLVYMRTAQGYQFKPRGGSRILEIRLGGDAQPGMVVSGLATSAAGNGTEISYTLSSDAEVEVTVLNIAGRLVRTLVSSAAQPAGAQRVVWNGANNAGVRAPSGMYLIVVRARAEDGQEAQAIGPLTVGP